MTRRDDWMVWAGVAVVALVIWGIVAAVQRHRENDRMIADGLCEMVEEGVYDPPPQVHFRTQRIGDHTSTVPYTVDYEPYWRTIWRCPGNRVVTRRSSSW